MHLKSVQLQDVFHHAPSYRKQGHNINFLFFDPSSQEVMIYTDYCYFVKTVLPPFAAMAPSKKVLATVSRGQLPSFCRIGIGGCNNFALGFTGGS